MRKLGIMLLAVALIFVGLNAFGSINPVISTEGLTVNTLMLPFAEKTVEAAQGNHSVDIMGYAEMVVATNVYSVTSLATIGLSGRWKYPSPIRENHAHYGHYVPGTGSDRLLFEILRPPDSEA